MGLEANGNIVFMIAYYKVSKKCIDFILSKKIQRKLKSEHSEPD